MNTKLSIELLSSVKATFIMLGICSSAAHADQLSPECSPQKFNVDLEQIGAATLAADVCGMEFEDGTAVVMLLLHGGAYDRQYWAPPHSDTQYSYVKAGVEEGYIIVNLDRLGYGESTRPNGDILTFDLGADAVSDVVDQIHAGALGQDVETIILNGHSMGGIVAEIAAAENQHVSGLIVSGLANTPDTDGGDDEDGGGPPAGRNPFVPAQSDAKFADHAWADTYVTTAPGVRSMIFHAPSTIDDSIAELEADMRHTIANAEIRSVMSGQAERPTFNGPSVHFLGQFDRIACEGQDCAERFAGTNYHTIISGAGHSINLSLQATTFFKQTFEWLEANDLAP